MLSHVRTGTKSNGGKKKRFEKYVLAVTMCDQQDDEQSLSNLFEDEGDNFPAFAEQSMAISISCIAVEKEYKQLGSSGSNSSSMQASKSISTLFSKMAWNGSTTSFMGTGEELLHFSSSAEDLEGSSDVLALSKKPRSRKRFSAKYKQTPVTLQEKLSLIPDRREIKTAIKTRAKHSPSQKSASDTNNIDLDASISVPDELSVNWSRNTEKRETGKVRMTRAKQVPKVQEVVNDVSGSDFDASISIADVLAINWQNTTKKDEKPQFDDLQDSTLSETRRKPKRGLSRKESCLIESGRNKLRKSTTSSRTVEDVAPKCPRRCESPVEEEEERSLRLRVNDTF